MSNQTFNTPITIKFTNGAVATVTCIGMGRAPFDIEPTDRFTYNVAIVAGNEPPYETLAYGSIHDTRNNRLDHDGIARMVIRELIDFVNDPDGMVELIMDGINAGNWRDKVAAVEGLEVAMPLGRALDQLADPDQSGAMDNDPDDWPLVTDAVDAVGAVDAALARKERLDYLRGEIESESISMSEIEELQTLGAEGWIDDGDVVLLEWAGVPEFPEPTWVGYIAGADDGGPFEVMGDDSVPEDSPLAAFDSAYQFWDEVEPVTRMHIRVFDGDDYAYGWDPTDPYRLEGFGRDDIVLTDRDVYFHRKG